jgi:exonuclease III
VEDFNTSLSPMDRSSKQKINKEILEQYYTIVQMGLADGYRIFHPTSAQYTFFSEAHGTFSKTDHILGHKASLNKYKIRNETRVPTFPTLIQHSPGVPSQSNKARRKNKRNTNR